MAAGGTLTRGHGDVNVQRCKCGQKPRAKVQRWRQSLGVAGGGPGWQVAGRGATLSRPLGGRADASLPERQLGQHAVLPLPRRRRDESLHADFDLGLFREAFVAMGHDLIDVPRGLAEEAGDVPCDGFVLMRQRGQGFQVMA